MKKLEKITLYSYVTSPYAMKVHCYLLYKKLPFSVFYVNPLKIAKELPLGSQIPVLQIGEKAKANSSDIGCWLDQKFPDSAQLIPNNNNEVIVMDQWVTDKLIPSVFYLIYPQLNRFFLKTILSGFRLGYCVHNTTPGGLPPGLRYLWPVFIQQAKFIRSLVDPLNKKCTAQNYHQSILFFLNKKLEKQQYLATANSPSLADFSAWPQLVVPYQLRLDGFGEIMKYANIIRWIKDVEPYLQLDKVLPELVPKNLNPRSL